MTLILLDLLNVNLVVNLILLDLFIEIVFKRKDVSLVCDMEGVPYRWKEHFNELLKTGCATYI